MSDLLRSVPFEVSRADATDDGLTLEGYAAVFDTFTRIDSWEGTFDEQIRKGAFRKTIRENTPVLQFDHGAHPLIGSIPIGTIESLSEDDHGLAVTARLSDNWLVQPIRDAIASGAVDGMSFRFQVVREEWRDAETGKLIRDPNELMNRLYNPDPDAAPLQRTITEVKMAELGPVVFPAYAETSVGVRARSLADQIKNDKRNRMRARRDLANGQSHVFSEEVPEDLVADVARALLFDAPVSEDVEQDAPLTEEHPSETRNDAPLIEEHPSEEVTPISKEKHSRIKRDAAYRNDYLALIMKGANRYGD